MDQALDIPRVMGRAAKPVMALYARDLTRPDLELLATEKGSKPAAIKELKDSHHSLARALASGARPAEASLITGYSLSRISILQADPTFRELLHFYRERGTEALGDFQERLADIAKMAQAEIRDRLETSGEEFTNEELRKLMTDASDRIGHGPSSRQLNVNLNVGMAERMRAGLERAAKIVEGELILPDRK